jgi:hypothetical protein
VRARRARAAARRHRKLTRGTRVAKRALQTLLCALSLIFAPLRERVLAKAQS